MVCYNQAKTLIESTYWAIKMIKNTSPIQLREYQQEARQSVDKEFFQNKISRQLIVLPTGTGKTVLMAAITKHFNKKTLLLAHRQELIEQAYDTFKKYSPDTDIGICKAEKNAINKQIVIGSVQSCMQPKRLKQLKEQNFEVLMVDEAHHVVSDSYQKIINTLGFSKNSDKLLLGVTATPQRQGKRQLGDTFDVIAFSKPIGWFIANEFLSPVMGRRILTNFSMPNLRSYQGDFAINELAEAVNTVERNEFIVAKYNEYAPGRKGIAFCADIQHCKDLAITFKRMGIKAEAIWGDMKSKQRKKILKRFKNGSIDIVTSCSLLTEGFNEPSVSVILMARPTKSQGLYTQMVGRGLRIYPGKEDCLVLDFTDKHNNLNSIITLTKAITEAKIIQEAPTPIPVIPERIAKIEVPDEVDEEFDIIGNHSLLWTSIGNNELSLFDDHNNEIIIRPENNGLVADIYCTNGSKYQIITSPLPPEVCIQLCEEYAHKYLNVKYAKQIPSWQQSKEPPSEKQSILLKEFGHRKKVKSKYDAGVLIRELKAIKNKERRNTDQNSITEKQHYFLKNHGINTGGITKKQAMHIIGQLKQEQHRAHGYKQ